MKMFGSVPLGRRIYKNGTETMMSVHDMAPNYTIYCYTKQKDNTKTVEYFAHLNPEVFNTIDTVCLDSKGVLEIHFNVSFTPFDEGVMRFETYEEYEAWFESMKKGEPTDGSIRFVRPWVVEWVGKSDVYEARYTRECYLSRLETLGYEIIETMYYAWRKSNKH